MKTPKRMNTKQHNQHHYEWDAPISISERIPKSKRKQIRESLSFTNLARLNKSLQNVQNDNNTSSSIAPSIASNEFIDISYPNNPNKQLISRGMLK